MIKIIYKDWLFMIAAIIDMIEAILLKFSIHIGHSRDYTEQNTNVNTSLACLWLMKPGFIFQASFFLGASDLEINPHLSYNTRL